MPSSSYRRQQQRLRLFRFRRRRRSPFAVSPRLHSTKNGRAGRAAETATSAPTNSSLPFATELRAKRAPPTESDVGEKENQEEADVTIEGASVEDEVEVDDDGEEGDDEESEELDVATSSLSSESEDLQDAGTTTTSATAAEKTIESEPLPAALEAPQQPDLFDYFDPLLSPHAYPNGVVPPGQDRKRGWVAPTAKGTATTATVPRSAKDESENNAAPLQLDHVEYLGVPHPEPIRYRKEDYQDHMKLDNLNFLGVGTHSNAWPRDPQGLPLVDAYESQFDPTLSPHLYPQGAPRTVVSEKFDSAKATSAPTNINVREEYRPPLVGILLIDHGSKSEASNRALHNMAKLYEESVTSVVVQGAHMELGQPGVKEGMELLLNRGVDEIVCHPYFLGPGRHVSEDIPRLVRDAAEALDVQIPVRTTAHVGSDAMVMLGAIHGLVKQSSTLLAPSRMDRL
jgi:hypothetical protein